MKLPKLRREKTNKAKYCLASVLILLDIVFLVLGLGWAKTSITFLEYTKSANDFSTTSFKVLSGNDQFTQDIKIPYSIFNSIEFAINDFDRTNNSVYHINIQSADGQTAMDMDFNSSKLSDGKILNLSKKNVSINPNETYHVTISAKNVSDDAAIGFYCNDGDSKTIYYNIYGGEYRFWWTGLIIFISSYFLIIAGYTLLLTRKNKKLLDNRLFKALLFFGLILSLASVFCVNGYFTDEYDNIQGGILISKGATLYKDYVTQHTPFAYYLCSFFALLGAESVTQFRLMFYVFYALVWGFILFRYCKNMPEKRIVILGIATTCILPCLYTNLKLLYDIIQMLCFIVLLFEFISYYIEQKPTLSWTRCIIISLCIYVSISAAFNSVFTLVGFGIGFLAVEIKYWRVEKVRISKLFKRYYRLLISLIVPAIAIVAYFVANSALQAAYEQAFLFNTQVYPSYYASGYGSNILAPFVQGVGNFLAAIKDNVAAIAKLKIEFSSVFCLLAITLSIYTIFKQLRDKNYIIGFVLLMVICFSFSRENFHAVATWAMMLFSSVILFPNIKKRIPEWQWFIIAPVVLYLFIPYYDQVKSAVLYQQPPISKLEKAFIDNTSGNGYVGIDTYISDSLYFQYKNRKVANRNAYILPWYMAWYEGSVIDDFNEHQPSILIYNPDTSVWGIKYFSPRLTEYVEQNYTQDKKLPYLWTKSS